MGPDQPSSSKDDTFGTKSNVSVLPPVTDGTGNMRKYRRRLVAWDELQQTLCKNGRGGISAECRAQVALQRMKGQAFAIASSISKDIMASECGIKAILKLLCHVDPVARSLDQNVEN